MSNILQLEFEDKKMTEKYLHFMIKHRISFNFPLNFDHIFLNIHIKTVYYVDTFKRNKLHFKVIVYN